MQYLNKSRPQNKKCIFTNSMTDKVLNTIYIELLMFLKGPKQYLYLYTYPSDKYVKIKPYDPKVTELGNKLISRIHKLYPKLKIHFFGSAALKIAGQRDIDLFAVSNPKDFDKYLPGLIKILGLPKKRRRNFIEWSLSKNKCDIQFVLVSPNNPMFARNIRAYKLLKKNKQAYEKLKMESNGDSFRECEKKKLKFFYFSLGL